MHQFPEPVDLLPFAPGNNAPQAKYGLPRRVMFCRTCVISNQRPNSAVEFKHTAQSKKATIHFDESGVCEACRVAKDKRGSIDWEEREAQLEAVCNKFRSRNGNYDCLVPGSGGKDRSTPHMF